jgi:FkbM family methyltransferase
METLIQHEIAEAQLQGPQGRFAFRMFKTESAFQIAHDIFAGTTYPHVSFVTGIKTILDIGANVGAASVFFALLYPGAKVYAFEPASEPFSLLQPNTAQLSNVHAFPFGFYSQNKQTLLYHGRKDSMEASVCLSSRTDTDSEEIRLLCAPQFLAEQGITNVDIIKLDTEGCEVPVLQSLQEYLPAVKILYVEYHSDRDRRLIDAMLADTHVLWRGQASLVHRGEFCYLNRELIPEETYTSEILLPLD